MPQLPSLLRGRGFPGQMEGKTLLSPPQGQTGHASCLPPPPAGRESGCLSAWPLQFAFLSLETSGCYKHSLLTLPSIGCPGAQGAKRLGLAYRSLGQPQERLLGNGRRGAGPEGAVPLGVQ